MSDLSPEAKAFIDAARPHEGPAAGERDQVRRALAANLAAGAALGAATKTSAAAGAAGMAAKGGAVATVASVGATTKIALSLAVVGLLGGGALAVARAPHHPPLGPAAAIATTSPPLATPVAATTATANGERLAGADDPPASAPDAASTPGASSAVDAAPAVGTAPATVTQPSATAPNARPIALSGSALAQAGRTAAPLTSPPTALRPTPVVPPTAAPIVAPTSSASLPNGPASPRLSALDEEVRRLGEVQRALREGDAARALRLLDAGGAGAGGALRDERRAARFLALCRLGRDADANAEAARLLAASPNSPVALRVRKGCPPPGSR